MTPTSEDVLREDVLQDLRVRALIERGARDGALSYQAINAALGDLLLDEEGAEAVLSALEERGVQLINDVPLPTPTPREAAPRTPRQNGATSQTPAVAPKKRGHSDLDEALASLDELLSRMQLPGEGEAKRDVVFSDEEVADAGVEDALKQYLNRMGQVALLTPDEEARLTREARDGSDYGREEAKRQLAEANLRLVVSIARAYSKRTTLPFLDLIQEGNVGLMRAVDKFKPERGERLASFASWYIREAIKRAVNEQARLVRLPSHLAGVLRRVEKVTRELTQELGRAPGHDEIAQAANLSLSQLEDALRVGAQPLSLEAPTGEGDDSSELGDLIASDGEDSEDSVARGQLREELARALDGLSEREKAVLQMRFGVGAAKADGPRSLEDIGRELKVSSERVHRLEVRALRKLRRRSRAGALQAFLSDSDE